MSAGEEAAPAQQQKPEEQQQQPEEKPAPPPEEHKTEEAAAAAAPEKAADEAAAVGAPPAEPPQPEVTYKSLVLSAHGGYDKVKLQTKKGQPKPKAGELLVRVRACGLNFSDLLARQGVCDRLPSMPVSLGMECAGEVEELGDEVTDRQVGDKVMVFSRYGLWQELVTVPANRTFIMPEGMSFEEGAAFLVNYITAYMIIFHFGNLRPKQSILIHMAAGGVGNAAIQLCKTVKDVTIFGTASSTKHEALKEIGVTHLIDYRTSDYVEEVRKISPKGVDIVLDPLGGSDTCKGYNLLKPMGRLVIYGAANLLTGQKKNIMALAKSWWNQFSINAMQLIASNKAVCGYLLGRLDEETELIGDVVATLLDLYKQGQIKPKIDSVYPFEQFSSALFCASISDSVISIASLRADIWQLLREAKVGDAMRQMQEKKNVGKVILVPELPKEEAKNEEAKKEEN